MLAHLLTELILSRLSAIQDYAEQIVHSCVLHVCWGGSAPHRVHDHDGSACPQEAGSILCVQDKVNKACSHFEGGIKEVDVRMSVAGGDRGTGAKQQKTEITVYTLSNGVVRAEDVEESMYASIDLVSDKLARKLRKVRNPRQQWQLLFPYPFLI